MPAVKDVKGQATYNNISSYTDRRTVQVNLNHTIVTPKYRISSSISPQRARLGFRQTLAQNRKLKDKTWA